MKLYLATPHTGGLKDNVFPVYSNAGVTLSILESFVFVKPWMDEYICGKWDFLLDSGAFSFFGKGGAGVDWDDYVDRYAQYINERKIQNFIELDIEKLVGLPKMEDLRKRLQDKTGRNPIPVWRPSRGSDYWHRMVEEFSYIAISASGMFDSGWTRLAANLPILKQMVGYAKTRGVRVHGLGYTKLTNMLEVGWASVDSTSWVSGSCFGMIYQFTGKSLQKTDINTKTHRLKSLAVIVHNYGEWVKLQQYVQTLP